MININKVTHSVNMSRGSLTGQKDFDPETATGRKLITSMVLDGWDKEHPIIEYGVAEELEHLAEPRFPFPESFALLGETVTYEDITSQFEVVTYGTPTRAGNSGARRFSFLPIVNALRLKLGMEVISKIPSTKAEYSSDLERDCANIKHNNMASIGKREIAWEGPLEVSRTLLAQGMSKVDIMRKMSLNNGLSQKTHALCVANTTWPQLNVVDRVLDGTFTYEDLKAGEIRKLTATTAKSKAGVDFPVPELEALAYFNAPKSEVNEGTSVTKASVEALIKKTHVQPFRIALSLAKDMDVKGLESFNERSHVINTVWEGVVHPETELGVELQAVVLRHDARVKAAREAAKKAVVAAS